MDSSLYKTHTVSRGITYSYYFSPAKDDKRTIVFLHGFPSTSQDWKHQVAFFVQRGYGALVPDMLGYGGTDKPTIDELDKYLLSPITQDILDLVEKENVGNAVVVGHDWGSAVTSRVAQLQSGRFDGFAFLALGYMPPNPNFEIHKANEMTKQRYGYHLLGYQIYHSQPGTAETIESHWDSYLSLLFPLDSSVWKSDLGPNDGMKNWLEQDRKAPLASYITPEEKERVTKALLGNGGMKAPLLWYNVVTSGLKAKEDKLIPESDYTIKKPVFLGGAKRDYICVIDGQVAAAKKYCPDLVIKEYDSDHWVQWSHADEVNRDLLQWMEESLPGKAAL